MFLEWDKEPEYVNWTDGPKYVTVNLSDLADDPDTYLLSDAHVKVIIDLPLSYEEVNYMKEIFTEQYGIRELKMVPKKNEEHINEDAAEVAFETVDQIVVDQIATIESDTVDRQRLIKIYHELD